MLDKKGVGKRIAYYRKEHGMTQKDLAALLNISYQAVSKWEAGISLPTVEMLYDIAKILNMTVDGLLNEEAWAKRQITYMDTGLDTRKLYELKNDVQKLVSDDKRIVSSWYADACLFQMDTSQMKDPVYSCVTCIPGSKEKMAKEYHYNKEICADVAASAINFTLQHGIRPSVLKAFVLCGNYDYEQLYMMAQTFQEVCKQNDMLFTGMEIAAQPVNFSSQEYNINATVVGVQDRDKLLNYEKIKEGDALIGMRTQGIDGTHYPIIKVMLDRRPDLLHAKIDEEHFLLEEMMKANVAYTREIMSLQNADICMEHSVCITVCFGIKDGENCRMDCMHVWI